MLLSRIWFPTSCLSSCFSTRRPYKSLPASIQSTASLHTKHCRLVVVVQGCEVSTSRHLTASRPYNSLPAVHTTHCQPPRQITASRPYNSLPPCGCSVPVCTALPSGCDGGRGAEGQGLHAAVRGGGERRASAAAEWHAAHAIGREQRQRQVRTVRPVGLVSGDTQT